MFNYYSLIKIYFSHDCLFQLSPKSLYLWQLCGLKLKASNLRVGDHIYSNHPLRILIYGSFQQQKMNSLERQFTSFLDAKSCPVLSWKSPFYNVIY